MVFMLNHTIKVALYVSAIAVSAVAIALALYFILPGESSQSRQAAANDSFEGGRPESGRDEGSDNDQSAVGDRSPDGDQSQQSEPDDDGEALTVLLAGRDEESTDSMLLVRVEAGEGTAKILSVPRDIWHGGQKLNQKYAAGGPEAMVEAFADITGFAPDHYAVVDMEGFVRIIDHLGGITVTLDEPLSDDTLLTPDEESWLEFSEGTHEISGAEALLIARSRATSSDFDRSRRQSRIIEGLQQRISELSLNDLPTLYEVARTAFEYLDTDISVPEAVGYFLKYGVVDDFERAGLSTDNVLKTDHSLYLPDDEVPWRSADSPADSAAEDINRREGDMPPEDRRPFRGNKTERIEALVNRDAPRLSELYEQRVVEEEEELSEGREEVDEAMDTVSSEDPEAAEDESGTSERGAAGEDAAANADAEAPADGAAGEDAGDPEDGAAEQDSADAEAPADGTDGAPREDGANPDDNPLSAGAMAGMDGVERDGERDDDDSPSPPVDLPPGTISLKRRVVDSSGISRSMPARGLWILLPHDDDWDHIRWYAEAFFSDDPDGPPSEEAVETRLGL